MRRPVIALISLSVSLLCAAIALRVVLGPRPLLKIVSTEKDLFPLLRQRARQVGHEIEAAELVRIPIDAPTAAVFFPANEGNDYYQYDPLAYSRPAPRPDAPWTAFPEHPAGGFRFRANSLGLREDHETETEKRDLRVLVVGDSHTYGLCGNSESFAHLLEGLFAERLPGREVEVLNGAAGYYHFYNYLGAFERLAFLDPDVLVLVAYGGNDFSGSMILQRYFHARLPPEMRPYRAPNSSLPPGAGPQEMVQVMYFLNNPADEPLAVHMAVGVTQELCRFASERHVEVLVAYLPPPFRGQPTFYAEEAQRSLETVGCAPEALEISDRLADGWLSDLRSAGIRTLDLRAPFQAAAERLYWKTDLHLNLSGHRLVAQELAAEVAPLLAAGTVER